jgi:CBS domain-containing protein
MKIRDIMTKELCTAEPDTTLEEIAVIMRDAGTGAIPVVEDGELTGIVTDRDIVLRCIAEGRDPSGTRADDIVSEELVTIGPDADVQEAARIMGEHQIRRLPVVEKRRLVGMLSLGDFAVKSDIDEERAGDTLEIVSEGVKASGKDARRASRTPDGGWQETLEKQGGRRARSSEGRNRIDVERGDLDRSIDTGPRRQGISAQPASREQKRQSRVVPIRQQKKAKKKTLRGRTSSSRRKAG